MPKIIENLESKLVEEAQRQIERDGYRAVTIRSVAQACGVGVGTVYNYFASKDELLATYMLRDWNECIAAVTDASDVSRSPEPVLHCIYDQLRAYASRNAAVFYDESAAASFSSSLSRYHAMLRAQLSAPLRKFCGSDFAADFIAESLLTWTMEEKDFDEIFGMIDKLF